MDSGFRPLIEKECPSLIGLQETRTYAHEFDYALPKEYHVQIHEADRAGYAGTALLCRHWKPETIMVDFLNPSEGRLMYANMYNFWYVNVYVPNAKKDLSRMREKLDWWKSMHTLVMQLRQTKPVILGGDINITRSYTKWSDYSSGMTTGERYVLDLLLEQAQMVDVARTKMVDEAIWSTFLVDRRLMHTVLECKALPYKGSNHAPLFLRLRN
jgi:exodeoxyribonuclease-3